MNSTTPNIQPPQTCKVIIIGAGFAGLAAGTTLCNTNRHLIQASDDIDHHHQPHFTTEDVVILEASDRVGGRACTLPLSKTLSVELGCTWIHGIGTQEQPNPVLAVATAAALMATPRPQKWWGSTFLLPGRKEELTKEENIIVHKAIEAYAAAVDGIEAEDKEEEGSSSSGKNVGEVRKSSLGAAVDAAWLKFLQNEYLDTNKTNTRTQGAATSLEPLARAAWQWREQLQRAIDGCNSTHDMDATARSLYTDFGESEVHAPIPCGYQKVAETLATGRLREYSSLPLPIEKVSPSATGRAPLSFSPAPNQPLIIKLNHQVDLIEWGSSGNDTKVTITCSNGACFQASAAIITTSLGVLKQRHEKMFSPNLPERKIEAIERLKIGVVDKIIIDFSPALDENEEEEDEEDNDGENRIGENFENSYLEADQGVVTYALLWGDEEELSTQGLPEWAKGIFSIRWGGPEFKRKRRKKDGIQEEGSREGGDGDDEAEPSAEDDKEENDSGTDEDVPSSSPKYSQAVMWITGDAARSMEAASDTHVLQTIKAIFKKFPGIALPLKQNIFTSEINDAVENVDDETIEEDIVWEKAKLIRSQWGLNPYTAGSYSYVGPSGGPEDVVALAAPITQGALIPCSSGGHGSENGSERPVLLFAGEACHVQYIGTTHAAYLTGKEAAEILLKEEGKKSVP